MSNTKENLTLKSLSQEESHEQIEDPEKKSCIASECIFARWSKPVTVRELIFVSKDVLLIHAGKTLIFHNVKTKKEDILVVGGYNSAPSGGDCLPLDGIGCVDSCGIDLLALAEQPPAVKVVICRYPDLKVLATLSDCGDSAAYKSILFMRLEYLIGLRDYPAFDFVVWAWRIQEKLLVVNTGFIQPNQSLSLSTAGRDVYLSLTERDVTCKLQLWTLFISCKTVYTEKISVNLPENVVIQSGCWTSSGWFVFCDTFMNVYRTQPSVPTPDVCVKYEENNSEPNALICPTKQGFILYTTKTLTCFKDSKGVFAKIWTIVIGHTLQSMIAEENDIYGWTDEGVLLELTPKQEQVLKVYGSNVKYFTFIKPTDETVATINEKNILQVWDVSNGEFRSEMKLSGYTTHLCSNPIYYYVAVSFKSGKIELLKSDPKTNYLELIAKLVLCDEELSSVLFFRDGENCIVNSFPSGRFYYVSVKLGKTCSVIREFQLKKQVIDVKIVENKNLSFLIVLYKHQETVEHSGNNIIIYDINFNAVVELIDTEFHYSSILKWISFSTPNLIKIAFVVMLSKCIHLMNINVVQAKLLELETLPLNHSLRGIQASTWKDHCITFSHDGTYNIYEFNDDGKWKNIVMVNCSHWQTGGLLAAQVDVNARNILTLSRQGNFTCTSFKENCHNRRVFHVDTPVIVDDVKTDGIGYENELKTPKRMTWAMISEENKINASKLIYSKQKNQIMQDFKEIKAELLTLFEKNINGPEEKKISVEEFDLNVEHRQLFRKKSKTKRNEYESKILDDIKNFNMETKTIIKEHWESLFVKPKSIYCLKKLYKVDNYLVSLKEQEVVEKANQIIKKRIPIKKELESYLPRKNSTFSENYLKVVDDEKILIESNDKQSLSDDLNDISMTGSISYRFVDTVDYSNSQYDYYKLEMAKEEIVLHQYMVIKLKHSFNKLFDDMFIEKQHQLDELKECNDRLRVIETELRLACKIESIEPLPVNYDWNQFEQTERLIHVEDDEVPVKCYKQDVLPSQRSMIDTDLVEKEKNSQLLVSDSFRKRALIDMMDGVLEKKWEDELKKDVPKPQCMLKKKPETYSEDDIIVVNDYKKAVITLSDERMKYKKILEEEKIKIVNNVENKIEKFDNSVFELFQVKLKYNSAINQEFLKIIRQSKMLSESKKREREIQQHRETISKTENTIMETAQKISKTETTNSTLLNTIEAMKHKNNILNKRFKSEFPSKLIYEQALIAYNRRPKIHGYKNYSSLLGYQFVNTIMDPKDDKLDLLCSEFVQYLDTLRVYDDYKYVDDYKLNMDRDTWHKVCNFRRMKIESEFRISTYQKDVADKTNLLANLERDKEEKEATIEKLKSSIVMLENQNSYYKYNPEIQLIVKRGNIEIELTGHLENFVNTMLITKQAIEEVNTEIKKTGKTKINTLTNLLAFQCKCRFLEWEHEILKEHKIKLFKNRFDVIASMKITENMLHYLKYKTKGINIAKQAEQNADKEIAGIQITYGKKKKELMRLVDELTDKIENVKKENDKTDKSIEEMHLYLSQLKNEIDESLNNKHKALSEKKLKNIMKRAQMITSIQELHKEIIMLHTGLELLLLKTFPTLYNTSKTSNTGKC